MITFEPFRTVINNCLHLCATIQLDNLFTEDQVGARETEGETLGDEELDSDLELEVEIALVIGSFLLRAKGHFETSTSLLALLLAL